LTTNKTDRFQNAIATRNGSKIHWQKTKTDAATFPGFDTDRLQNYVFNDQQERK
jgi:hypothetical protein